MMIMMTPESAFYPLEVSDELCHLSQTKYYPGPGYRLFICLEIAGFCKLPQGGYIRINCLSLLLLPFVEEKSLI